MKNDIKLVEKTGRYRIVIRRASRPYGYRDKIPQFDTLGFIL